MPNIQANILDRSNVSAALADDRDLVVDEQLETDTFPFHEEITLPLEDGHNFVHFVHLNCNSLLSKIDEIREFVLKSKPHIIGFF